MFCTFGGCSRNPGLYLQYQQAHAHTIEIFSHSLLTLLSLTQTHAHYTMFYVPRSLLSCSNSSCRTVRGAVNQANQTSSRVVMWMKEIIHIQSLFVWPYILYHSTILGYNTCACLKSQSSQPIRRLLTSCRRCCCRCSSVYNGGQSTTRIKRLAVLLGRFCFKSFWFNFYLLPMKQQWLSFKYLVIFVDSNRLVPPHTALLRRGIIVVKYLDQSLNYFNLVKTWPLLVLR